MFDTDTRRKNYDWQVRNADDRNTANENRRLAVLMDIRDELQTMNSHLHVIREWFHQRGMGAAIRTTIANVNRRERVRQATLRAARKARKAAAGG